MNPSHFNPLCRRNFTPGETAGSDFSVIVQFYIVLEMNPACWRTPMHNIHKVVI